MDSLSGKPCFTVPAGPLSGYPTVNPRRRFAPLLEPPSLVPLLSPLPPSLHRNGAFTRTHTISIHVFPAAFPRQQSPYGNVEVPSSGFFEDKGVDAKLGKRQWVKDTVGRMIWEKAESTKLFPDPRAGMRVAQEGLWVAVTRIRRNRSTSTDGDEVKKWITIVAAHASGFHKETWEPVLRHVIEATERKQSSIQIDEIWSLDAVNQGDCALINGPYLPRTPDTADYSRDLANFLINYLPEGPFGYGILPFELTRLSSTISKSRIDNGYTARTVVPLGHSLGGYEAIMCAINYPELFAHSALLLVDPPLFPPNNLTLNLQRMLLVGKLGRQSSWRSRKEARESLLKTPTFKAFDSAILDVYVEHALHEDRNTGTVQLKCSPYMEASEFTERRTLMEAWELLPTVDERIELRWILGDRHNAHALAGGTEITRRTVWRRPGNASNVRIKDGGHLLVQEKPQAVAEDVVLFLERKFGATQPSKEIMARL